MSELSPDDLKVREVRTRREFPETQAAFAKVRAAMVLRLFATKTNATEERERLYFSVQTLDAVEAAMTLAMGQGSDAIEEYAKSFATTDAE